MDFVSTQWHFFSSFCFLINDFTRSGYSERDHQYRYAHIHPVVFLCSLRVGQSFDTASASLFPLVSSRLTTNAALDLLFIPNCQNVVVAAVIPDGVYFSSASDLSTWNLLSFPADIIATFKMAFMNVSGGSDCGVSNVHLTASNTNANSSHTTTVITVWIVLCAFNSTFLQYQCSSSQPLGTSTPYTVISTDFLQQNSSNPSSLLFPSPQGKIRRRLLRDRIALNFTYCFFFLASLKVIHMVHLRPNKLLPH